MQLAGSTYEEITDRFEWEIPSQFNIGVACCDIHTAADPQKVALFEWAAGSPPKTYTYGDLTRGSNQLANALKASGFEQGDRLGIILPQTFETVVSHLATYKLGGIAVPLARLFAADALHYRLGRAGVSVVITNRDGLEKTNQIRSKLPDLKTVICTADISHDNDAIAWQEFMSGHSEEVVAAETGPDTPALIIFTSGTTGPPKGALHGHRVLLGHLPGIQVHHEFFPKADDRIWTPADWAWAGGLLNVLLPALYYQVPVVFGGLDRFDPEKALQLMQEMEVRNAFIPPTALKMLKSVQDIGSRYDLKLRTIGSGGESLGSDTYEWAKTQLGVTVNEFYGQTECNLVLSSMQCRGVSKAGAIGKPVPGHVVGVVDNHGNEVVKGEQGQIAIKAPNPVMFLGYWEDEQATREKFAGDWMTTGDQAFIDQEGYFRFVGRDDDIINSAGYRVGPGEIEDCLATHPAVQMSVAVGKPDRLKSEVVKAYVVLNNGWVPSPRTEDEIKQHVKARLAANIYPREIEFVDSIPLTTTGKVIRRTFREKAGLEG